VEKETLLEHLKGIRDPSYVLVSRELHVDGNPHLHAYVYYKTKLHIRNSNTFNIGEFQASIEATRSVEDWTKYVKEDGDWVEWGYIYFLKIFLHLWDFRYF